MFLLGALFRFGKVALVFLFIVAAIWIVARIGSFVVRWLLDQLGIEVDEVKVWIKSKLPKRKKKKSFWETPLNEMSDEQMQELRLLIKRLLKENSKDL